jgi:hypothetical protein
MFLRAASVYLAAASEFRIKPLSAEYSTGWSLAGKDSTFRVNTMTIHMFK